MESVFEYRDYKRYLKDWIASRPHRGRGMRSELAQAIGCQTAYVSHVLNGHAQFSLEQADLLNLYVQHGAEEAKFFLLLVQWNRAGTARLREHFHREVEAVIQKRLVLKNRFDVKQTLSEEDQAIYYGSWIYSAIHMAASLPQLQDKDALARRLNLPPSVVGQALEFLVTRGLLARQKHGHTLGTARLHLGADSPLFFKHHTNWRIQAIRSLEQAAESDLHYSSVITVSKDDILRLKIHLVKAIEEAKHIIKESKEEEVLSFSLDFFKL